jgi:outer membrane protein TolC
MFGPNLSSTLPIFDQNQAQIAKARYTQAQTVRSYEDLLLSISRDIRIATERAALLASNVMFFEQELLPQSQRNLELTEVAWEAGAVDVLTLLRSQSRLLDTQRRHVTALAQAAAARVDLELAVGRPLTEVAAALASEALPEPMSLDETTKE